MEEIENAKEKDFTLSASKISTYNKCSLTYYAKYIEKVPDVKYDGTIRGSIVHEVFEYLLKKKDKKRVQKIIDSNKGDSDVAVKRMIKKLIKEFNLSELDDKGNNNYDMICDMIIVGLKYDFFCEKDGGEVDYENVEKKFLIDNKDPEYKLVGLIDKPAIINNRYGIFDYKSSSNKKTDQELDWDIQTASYTLFAKKVKQMDAFVEYIFLRYPDDPIGRASLLDDTTLEGFEYYLSDMYFKLKNFSEDDALENLAYDKGYLPKEAGFAGRTSCGYAKWPGHSYSERHKDPEKRGRPYFSCPYKFGFSYFVAVDDNGEIIKTSKDKGELSEFENIEEREWKGCPRWTDTKEYQGWLQNNID